jgi:NAD(P)H-nitrite reductase large subunit
MPKKDHYVIIGNGPAGNKAADVLRENDRNARITILSDEHFSFYYRHKLCDFMSGVIDEDTLKVKFYKEYKEKNIRLRLGQRVEKIDPDSKTLFLKHMEKLRYTKLILAVGSAPRVLPSLLRYKDYFTFMSNYIDAANVKSMLENIKNPIVIGGDLIGINFIKMLSRLKKKATFFMYYKSFWPFDLDIKKADAIRLSLEKNNIKTISGDPVKTISRRDADYIIETESGREIEGDALFSFMGRIPNIQFIKGSGIDTERGILVNEYLQANYKDIYACGDCAQIYNLELKDYWISIGWENSILQGEVAAYNLLGEHRIIKPMSKKIFNVEGIKVKTSWWNQLKT